LNSSNSKNKNRRNYTNSQRPSAAGFPMAANLWHGALQLWAGVAHPGLLGTHPGSHQPPRPQAFMVQTPSSAPVPGFQGGYTPVSALHGGSSYGSQPYGSVPPGFGAAGAPLGFGAPGQFFSGIPTPPGAMWDQNALTAVFSATSLTPPPSAEWYMDFGADSHMTSTTSNLLSSQPPSSSTPSSIFVGNRSLLPITSTSHTFFPTPNRPIHFSHILVSPHIIKILISVYQFTIDNQISVEFDPYGPSVKDTHTRNMVIRSNSSRQLYPLFPPASSPSLALLAGASSSTLWHRQLGHLGFEALSRSVPSCNKLELVKDRRR
jgi:hypothetical protein